MRRLNRTLVLDVLKSGDGPMSRASIAQATSLAKPTVSEIVEDLMAEGAVREVGMGTVASAGGRPPKLLEFDARSHFVAGVHVGSRTTTVVIGDATGKELGRESVETDGLPAEENLQRIAQVVKATARHVEAPLERFEAAGVVVPGLVDFHAGVCLLGPNIGWRDVPIADILGQQFDFPVFVHNVSQAAVVAETLEGAAKGESEVVLLYGGSGVGAGILWGGRVFHGSRGITGEIGHCRLPGETGRCKCGKFGCLETAAGASALVARVWRGITSGATTSLAGARRKDLTPQVILQAAVAGDGLARGAIAQIGRNLGIGASWLVNLFNPAILVIAGGLAEFGTLLLDPLREAVHEMAMTHSYERVEIRAAQLGQNAEVRGAVLLAMQRAEIYYRIVFQA
jgi:glucokinase-like ROK family protein